MAPRYRDDGEWSGRARRGTGSVRERSPGVWEIRVVVGFDPVRSRSIQRSFTVHGDESFAQQRRAELTADFGVSRVNFTTEAARLTVAELMERFFEAPHLWNPATVASHRPVVKALMADELGRRRLVTLTAGEVRAAICRWKTARLSVSTVSARWLVLRSAVSWAVAEGILRSNPLASMRGPARPEPRRHHSPAEVKALLGTAQAIVAAAARRLVSDPVCAEYQRSLFAAEQTLLVVRLAVDSAARRGELAVRRRLTLGRTTVALINDHVEEWDERWPDSRDGD